MNRTLNLSVISGIFFALALAFQNCSQVGFTSSVDPSDISNGATGGNDGSGDDGSGDDTNCRVDLVNTTKSVKVLFLIDTSGSNQSNNGKPGTDMDKKWRLATINSFINAYGSKSNFQFGFAIFQGSSATPLIKSDTHGVFTNDMAKIDQAITDFKNTPDQGYTPYDAALDVVNDMIEYDQQLTASKEVGYVVIMVSDGRPTNDSYTSANGMTNLTNDVNNIMSLASTQISLNTVYLYNEAVPSASEKSYLQKIASVGKGAFIEASSQQTLEISDTIQVPKTTCQ